ncbi:conserved hypothetical protein [Anaeromyxobacter dehalogenans 2CP-1]|uniref:Lipoprotein n=1 Tax=Anaeromyxobacter dehalogenans (strain ATCC BAA-258 / DSM 21875 / 2CP-1) TaxID=455488 RepID=B8JBJ2_ANAD2|nr:hypothetical protein [Anaeromyxobacter dehalogenans]ACL67600.1 conserved hypothetical protein [Anaeromyxobacter dehalogenans 2CP-1]
MRALPALALLSAVATGLSGCSTGDCAAPAGCVRAERHGGACGCAEWEIVDTQAVTLPYVVTDVDYQPFGAGSGSYTGHAWVPMLDRYSDTSEGTNVRIVIRSADGGERVARVGNVDPATGLERVTESVLRTRRVVTLILAPDPVDISDPGRDFIELWMNAALTVDTDASGARIVHWSLGSGPDPAGGAYQGIAIPVRTLQEGGSGASWLDDYLAGLGPEGRAEIVAFDERVAGPPMSERYLWIESSVVIDRQHTATLYQWTPCTDPEAFEVLAETAVPLANGETLVLQYGVQADSTCSPQSPGMYLEMTPGCETGYQMFVDRLSGKLMMLASPHGTCTGP